MNKSKSRLRVAGALALSMVMLSACATDSGNEDGNITLRLWTFDQGNADYLEQAVQTYLAENPHLTIEFQGYPDADYVRVLTTAWASDSGNAPDLALIKAYGIVQSFIDNGNLQKLDPADFPELPVFDQKALDGVSDRNTGDLYGIPFTIVTGEIYYNTDIFDELGLTVPKTYEEFIAMLQKIEQTEYVPIVWPSGETVHGAQAADILMNARRGGTEWQDRFLHGETDATDADFVGGLEVIKEVSQYTVDHPQTVTREDALALFSSGKAVTYANGPWIIAQIRRANPDINFASFSMPASPSWPSGTVKPGASDGGVTLSAKSAHPEEAKKLLNWLSTNEPQSIYVNISGKLPARTDVVLEDKIAQQVFDDYLDHGTTQFFTVYTRYGVPSGTDLISEAAERMFLGATPTEAAKGFQDGMDAWFVPMKRN